MNALGRIHYTIFDAKEHLPGVLRLCEEEGWESFPASPEATGETLRAPGVTTVVAVQDGAVIGCAQMQSGGPVQAHPSVIVVDRRFRGRGVGRRLVEETFARSGAKRVDSISGSGAEGFYESFAHKARSGFRIYSSRRTA